jgi:DNA-binding Xre family transcriptional regulator
MPFYSAYTASGYLVNTLKTVLDTNNISSFKLSKITQLSPTTTRKIYADDRYIPSPDVLERICVCLNVQPGELLKILPTIEPSVALSSGVFSG